MISKDILLLLDFHFILVAQKILISYNLYGTNCKRVKWESTHIISENLSHSVVSWQFTHILRSRKGRYAVTTLGLKKWIFWSRVAHTNRDQCIGLSFAAFFTQEQDIDDDSTSSSMWSCYCLCHAHDNLHLIKRTIIGNKNIFSLHHLSHTYLEGKFKIHTTFLLATMAIFLN